MEKLIVRQGARNEEILQLKKLTLNDIEKIMALQEKVMHAIIHKETYASSSREEFEEIIKTFGCIMGYETLSGQLVALGAYSAYGYNEHNYGYDLGFEGEALLLVGQIESTIVDPDYRGNGLQQKVCQALEDIAKLEKKAYITATVSPVNPYSLNNFISLGYENKLEKLKYGGFRRYILCKQFHQ